MQTLEPAPPTDKGDRRKCVLIRQSNHKQFLLFFYDLFRFKLKLDRNQISTVVCQYRGKYTLRNIDEESDFFVRSPVNYGLNLAPDRPEILYSSLFALQYRHNFTPLMGKFVCFEDRILTISTQEILTPNAG